MSAPTWRRRPAAVAAIVVGLPLLGLVLMVAADNVPDRWVMDGLFEATVEGSLDDEPYGTGLAGGQVDEFTECVALTIGVGDEPGTGTVSSAVRAPTLGPCPTSVPKIEAWAAGSGLERSYDYFRYWHGHAVVLRPLVAVLGVAGARLVVLAALATVAAALWRALQQRFGMGAATALVLPIVATTDFVDLPRSLPHALSWVAMLATAWWFLRLPPADDVEAALRAAVAGAAFVFVDILLNPDAAFMLCVAAVGMSCAPGARVRRMSASALGWALGWGWMWCSKWIVAAIVLGADTVRSNIRDQIDLRVQGEAAGLDLGLFGGIDRTLDVWWHQPLTPWIVGATALWALWSWRAPSAPGGWWRTAVIAAPAAVPLVWFSLMRNHTQVHAFFTYRSWGVALGLVLFAVIVCAPTPRRAGDDDQGRRPK